jgi:CRP-like cAMP-binding protein
MFDYTTEAVSERRAFLADLHDDEIATIVGHTETRRFAAGDLAVTRADRDRSLFIVTVGRFDHDGTPRLPGDVFGELTFLDGQAHDADVVAIVDSEALVMTLGGLDRLRLREPRLGHLFLMDLGRVLSQQLRDPARSRTPGR